jgi:membrane protein
MSERRTDRFGGLFHKLPEGLRHHENARRQEERPENAENAAANTPAETPPDDASITPPVAANGDVHDDGHGRDADSPKDIPAKGWKDIAIRVKREVKEDNMGLVGAGVAFYTLLALFPAIVALISLYGLVVDPPQVTKKVGDLLEFMPKASRDVIQQQLENITASPKAGLGIGLAVSVLAALWSASGGMRALMTGLNIAYDEQESRKFIKLRLVSLALTLGAVLLAIVSMGGVIGVPAAFDASEPIGMALAWLRWPVLAAIMMAGLAVVYRYGPDRDDPKWTWVSWGAGIATLLWVIASAVFSFYVSSFGKFNKTYGTLAGVVVLMLWLSLSSFIVLLGAEINSELERQTAKDTTKGPDRPIGERDAYAADTVGATAEQLKGKKQPQQ